MLLKFSKHLQLSIWSSSTRINCQLLPLILVVSAFEVSLATVSSAVAKSSASTSFCSEHLSSLAINSNLSRVKLYYFSYLFPYFLLHRSRLCCQCKLFSHLFNFFVLVLSIS